MVTKEGVRVSVELCQMAFDGTLYRTAKRCVHHEETMRAKLECYLSHMPRALCYDINGDTCTAYYVTDDLDWVYLKLEVSRLEDELGFYSLIKNRGLNRLYRLKVSTSTGEISLLPYDDKYIASGKLDKEILEINEIRKNYKGKDFFEYETECCNLYI